MNKRLKAFWLLISVIITSLPLSFLFQFNVSASENLGSVTECKIEGDRIIISGSIKHSVLVSNRDSSIGVYKLLPWENVEDIMHSTAPLKQVNMSISFNFELPCVTIEDKTSLYAVALIDAAGDVTCISDPQYPDAVTADTSGIGFKGVKTDNASLALAAHAGSAIIDVYLDRLDNGNKSGHIFNADGDIFYFDRELIKQLDKQVLSYTAMGCEVIFRFLISPGPTNLPFCSDGRIWSTNKCVVVNDSRALNAIYAYTYFLTSRYDGDDYGKVSGIILGRGADMPILYNYASLISEDYDTVYARSLALIGIAAVNASGDNEISLIVPVGDSLTDKGEIYAERFLSSVAGYIDSHSKLKFTVMCESIHNPYHINDSMFEPDDPSDGTGEDGEEIVFPETELSPPETGEQVFDSETADTVDSITDENTSVTEAPDDVSADSTYVDVTFDTTPPNESAFGDETSAPEKPKPEINTKADGYYCTDSIDLFVDTFARLKKKYNSLNDGFAWCWYPDENTVGSSLGICYAYNYMKLAAESADFFTVAFEGTAFDRFTGIARLFKYIDTSNNNKETAYARDIFEIKEWSDIINGHVSSTGVYNVFFESELQPNVSDFIGSLLYMDYSVTHNVGSWYEGVFCNSIVHMTEGGEGFLQADLALDEAGWGQAEIGCVFKTPEPLLLGDALTFDIQCGESDGSLYEMTVYINSGSNTIVSKAVVAGGVRSTFSVDVKDIYNASAVRSIRISLARITGSGNCKLNLYSVILNSEALDNEALGQNFSNIRDYLRSDLTAGEPNKIRQTIITVVLLSSVALFSVLFAFANDRRLLKNTDTERNNIQKRKRNRI